MSEHIYDLIILGAGPGGYELALKAKKNGLDVIVIEEDKVGGTCLNCGCIPTKAYYKSAELYNEIHESQKYGITTENVKLDFRKVKERKDNVVNELLSGIEFLLAKALIPIVKGHGYFVNDKVIKVNDEEYKASNIVIATGSKAIELKSLGDELINSNDLLLLEDLPKSLAIIGGGVIGMEMASIFNAFGVEVSVFEMCDNILPNIDIEIAKRLTAYLKSQGIKIHTKTKVIKYQDSILTYKEKEVEKNEKFNIAAQTIGRSPNLNIGLENTSIIYTNKGISINENFMTNVEGVYAIGDVTGKQMLAHVATFGGLQVLNTILSLHQKINFEIVPSCVFTFPEVAVIGLNEEKCKEKGLNYTISKSFYRTNGKANAIGETDGFVKIIVCENKIIGTSIIGYNASILIHEFVPIMNNEIKIDELKLEIHAHPTLSEIVSKAIEEI